MCVKTLGDVERQCDITQGLKSTIYVAYEDEVATIGAAAGGIIPTITMAAGKYFSKIPISTIISKNSITGEMIGDDDGNALQNKLVVFSPGVSAEKSLIIGDTRRPIGYIVIAVSKEGKQYVLGAKEDPASIKPGMNVGETVGYSLEITHSDKYFPLEFSGTIPVAPAT